MNPTLLLIHNIGFIICAVLLVFLSCLVYIKDHRKKQNNLLILGFISILIWIIPQVIGVNIANPYLSRDILMAHVSILFISCFFAHSVFVLVGKEKEQRIPLIIFYTLSIILCIVYLAYPNTFLLPSMPKLYFPNYYVAGSLHWAMTLLSNVIIPTYFLVYMLIQYRHSNAVMKNRLKYLFAGFFLGYSFGALGIPLVYAADPTIFGITIDPVYSILFIPFFTIPFTYAILKYELMDIRIVAKRAFLYAALVTVVGVILALLQLFSDTIQTQIPRFPEWIVPLVSSIIAVSIGFFIWKKLRESDELKSEFITVVTHKFRTPLTEIRWATESFSANLSENDKKNINEIQHADDHLIDLTSLLVQLSEADAANYEYRLRSEQLNAIVEKLKAEYIRHAEFKGTPISFSSSSNAPVLIDGSRMRFVIQTLLDNAISYTPKGGMIHAEIKEEMDKSGKPKAVVFSVTDSGIGFSKEDLSHLFEKFWRSSDALKADTEGMGIGLFMAKRITERQGGTLSCESEGSGKGARFSIRFPILHS